MSISLIIEVPDSLHRALRDHLEKNPGVGQDQVFRAALKLFLSDNDPDAFKLYLDRLVR